MELLQDKEFFLSTWTTRENFFEVFREFKTPNWLVNSIYFMDHDSSGRCYCKWRI